ncbi:hypothetical protein GCM10020331_070690 [Ectobacillus funiculus]
MHNLLFDEIYAFGDGGNDISQFEIATQSVAMANAPEEVKAKATIVTKKAMMKMVYHTRLQIY